MFLKKGKKNQLPFQNSAQACRCLQTLSKNGNKNGIKSKFKKGIIPLADGVYYFYV